MEEIHVFVNIVWIRKGFEVAKEKYFNVCMGEGFRTFFRD